MERPNTIWNRRVVLLFITNLLVLAAFYASIPIIPVYCQEIGITGSGVGIVLTAMSCPPRRSRRASAGLPLPYPLAWRWAPTWGIQVQNHMSSKASFLTVFAITVAAFLCVSCCRIRYPKVE